MNAHVSVIFYLISLSVHLALLLSNSRKHIQKESDIVSYLLKISSLY